MRASWLDSREEGRARAALLMPLAFAAWFYGAGTRLHRALHRRGTLARVRLPVHVVSVGNLMTGGTGKTPLAAWLAMELRRRGRKVVIGSRGYGRRGGDRVLVVSDGRFVRSRFERAGDEPLVLAAHAPGVPVLVGNDRALVGMRALSAFGADVLVLDDGFQHHRLERDVDIVTFDGGQGFGNARLLPRGPLREPLAALRHAHAVGVVDGPLATPDAQLLEHWAPSARHFAARRVPVALRPLAGGAGQSPSVLEGARVGLLAGLARPEPLRRSLETLGARIVAQRVFRDHHRYRARDLRDLHRDAPLWVTTEKDAVKIPAAWAGRADVRVLVIELAVDHSREFVDWVEGRLR